MTPKEFVKFILRVDGGDVNYIPDKPTIITNLYKMVNGLPLEECLEFKKGLLEDKERIRAQRWLYGKCKPSDSQALLIKRAYPSITCYDEEYFNYAINCLDRHIMRLDCNKAQATIPSELDTDRQAESQQQGLPSELDTDRAREYFARAVELGLMSDDYKWLKGLQLLSCFAREMSKRLKLGKGINSDEMPRISWKPFEQLFGIKTGKLRANYNDIHKTGQQPSDIHLVDEVFG